MAFQVSPGVLVQENDLTTIIPNVSTSEAAFVGQFRWGPVEEVVLIDNEKDLETRFGRPNNTINRDFLIAAQFLAYSNNLKIVRAEDSTLSHNAVDSSYAESDGPFIKNRDQFESGTYTDAKFYAKYPGSIGNSLKVVVLDTTEFGTNTDYAPYFDAAPGANEVHIIIEDEDGEFTGTAGTILETFPYASEVAGTKDADNRNIYYIDWLNRESQYVWAGAAYGTAGEFSLTAGVDDAPTDANLQNGWALFANAEEVSVSLLIAGAVSATVADYIIQSVAEVRKDAIAFVSPELADVQNNAANVLTDIDTFRDSLTSSSYGAMDCNWKYAYDRYNDQYRWLPCNADVAGLAARTDTTNDPWFSPAGLNRGRIKNVVKLAWNPNKSQRDTLYKAGINPIIRLSGEGTILYGDKTLLTRPSAFDRINVRRLFIVLEKAISTAAKYSLFELNDEFTRAQFVNMVTPFLRDVKGRRGVYNFEVVCNETNNTPVVIDRNEFAATIRVQPARSINFITLSFVADRTGVSFQETNG